MKRIIALALSLAALPAAPGAAQDPADNYQALKAAEQARAGEPRFDYRLGAAALAAGEPVDAVFALSRVVASEPANIEARIALARAHAMLGDLRSARRQIAALSSTNAASPALAPVLDQYVAALDAALARRDAAFEAARADVAYLRGTALLDAERPAEAEQILRALLERQPGHLPARAELGRAFAMQGDYASARRELAIVTRDQTVPGEVRESIERYVAAFDTRAAADGTRLDGYVRVTAGYDSNVNNATDEERILIPFFSALGLATLSPDARSQEDGFAQTTARLSLVQGISENGRLLADLSGNLRLNFEQTRFDQTTLGGSLGYARDTSVGTFVLAGQAQTFLVGGDAFRSAFGALAGWTRRTSGGTDLSANLQYSYLDFPDNRSRDAHRIAAGFSAGRPVGDASYAFGGVYAGREEATDSRFDRLSQLFFGARAGVDIEVSPRLTLSGAFLAERQTFDEEEPLFQDERRTWRFDLRLGGRYRLTDELSLVTGGGYTHADSNIVLFDYDRFTAWMGLEFGF